MWYLIFSFCALLSHHGLVLAYKAAVLEHYASTRTTAEETIARNLEIYTQYADQAKQQSVDIIVFPEYGLTTIDIDPESFSTEINNNSHVIQKLTAMASERQIYVVVNLIEKEQFGSRVDYYNTNLVFNRNGSIVKKYRKINLFNETKLTPGSTTQDATFATDFGITFAMFTCFDILFKSPARTVFHNLLVTDIIFPTAWVSKMPFYLSLSVQHGYAMENGVNLLAANYGRPREGRGGSGIYLASGGIAETYIGDTSSSKLLVQDVQRITARENRIQCPSVQPFALPGDKSGSNVSDFLTTKAFSASRYQFRNVDLTQSKIETYICDNDFCCSFEIKVSDNQTEFSDIYKVMAFDGIVDFDTTQARIRVCGLVACENGDNDSCGARINSTTTFTKITVKGNLPKDDTSFYTPITGNSFLLPMWPYAYCDTNNGTNSSFVQLSTLKAQKEVLVFGLLGRTEVLVDPVDPNEKDDGGNDDGSSASTTPITFIAIITFVLFTLTNL